MIKTDFRLMAAALLSLAIGACTSDDSENTDEDVVKDLTAVVEKTPGTILLDDQQKAMVRQGNAFALNLLQTADRSCEGSYVLSPLSAGFLLGMMADGADSTARAEITDVLGFDKSVAPATVNAFFGNLLLNAPDVDGQVSIEAANAVFTNSSRGVRLDDGYASRMAYYYQALAESLDFGSTVSLERINGWCSEHTGGLIPEILGAGELSPTSTVCLLNTVLYKAHWTRSFNTADTRQSTFTLPGGTKIKLPLMMQRGKFDYMADGTTKAVSLPYGNGSYHMVLLMPADDSDVSLKDFIPTLTPERWQRITRGLHALEVTVSLPRFATSTPADLRELLEPMGLKTVFTPQADFSPMLAEDSQGKASFDMMRQCAFIQVNEEGTQAAGASIAGALYANENSYEFRANRPFVYVIAEKSSGVIFFIGKFTGEI